MENINLYALFSAIAFIVVVFSVLKPLQTAIKIILKCFVAAGAIIASNAFFSFIGAGISLGVNIINSVFVGLLGIPGLFALIIINKFFL